MEYSVLLYSGEYKIIESGSSKDLCCVKPQNTIQNFPAKEISKALLDDIYGLNLNSEKEILDFVNKWGVLVNTQNKEKKPTYCGVPIALKNTELVVIQKRGACMPLWLFIQQIELLKNILQLSAHIDVLQNSVDYTSTKQYKKDALELVHNFLNLLYQPYMAKQYTAGVDHIRGGDTSLSRFAIYFHECYLIGRLSFICKNYIEELNKELLRVSKLNDIKRIESGEREIAAEDDLFPKFEQVIYVKHIAFSPKLPVCSAISLSKECTIDSMENIELLKFLVDLNEYVSINFSREFNEINVEYRDAKKMMGDELMNKVCFWGKSLIRDLVNAHANIYHLLDVDENMNYQYNTVSDSLLQSIYLEMAEALSKNHVSRCRYHLCNKLLISSNTRSRQCCCKNHQNLYRRKIKRTLN